jgi:hypothetical protein
MPGCAAGYISFRRASGTRMDSARTARCVHFYNPWLSIKTNHMFRCRTSLRRALTAMRPDSQGLLFIEQGVGYATDYSVMIYRFTDFEQ